MTKLVLTVPKRLESPNASRGGHWRVRHRISMDWERELGWARVKARPLREDFTATGTKRIRVTYLPIAKPDHDGWCE